MLRRLDRTLADLLSFIDEHVGLERTVVVLSADHGMPEAPEYVQSLGTPAQSAPSAPSSSSSSRGE